MHAQSAFISLALCICLGCSEVVVQVALDQYSELVFHCFANQDAKVQQSDQKPSMINTSGSSGCSTLASSRDVDLLDMFF